MHLSIAHKVKDRLLRIFFTVLVLSICPNRPIKKHPQLSRAPPYLAANKVQQELQKETVIVQTKSNQHGIF